MDDDKKIATVEPTATAGQLFKEWSAKERDEQPINLTVRAILMLAAEVRDLKNMYRTISYKL